MGAIAGGADEGSLRRLTEYGRDIGLAFQMADDLLEKKIRVLKVPRAIATGRQTECARNVC